MTMFDLSLTMDSGQTPTFTWEKSGPQRYQKIAGGNAVWMDGKKINHSGISKKDVSKLFRMQDDVPAIYAKMAQEDPVLSAAVDSFAGLRLTQSDPWESTVVFLVSQNNHIPRIQQIVRKMHAAGLVTPEQIARTDLAFLKLGYREPFVKETARIVSENGFDLARLRRISLDSAREELTELPGVGPKVAECILLYGLGRPAFPQDVWVKNAMKTWYGLEKENAVRAFAQEQWGENAGYAQQLLFCHAREQLR